MPAAKIRKTKKKKVTKKKQARKKQLTKRQTRKKPARKKQAAKEPARKRQVSSQESVSSERKKYAQEVYRVYEGALILLHQKKYRKARDRFTHVVEKFSQEIEVVARAKSLLKVCEKNLRAKEKPPSTAEELFYQGVLYHNGGQYEKAVDCYSRALKLSKKKNDHIYYALAAAEVSAGDTDTALKHLEKAIEIKEENRFFAHNDPDFELLSTNQKFRELIYPS